MATDDPILCSFTEASILDPRWTTFNLGSGVDDITFGGGGVTIATGTGSSGDGMQITMSNSPLIMGPNLTLDFTVQILDTLNQTIIFGIRSSGDTQHAEITRTEVGSIANYVCDTKGLPTSSVNTTSRVGDAVKRIFRIVFNPSGLIDYYATNDAGDFELLIQHIGVTDNTVGYPFISIQKSTAAAVTKRLFFDRLATTPASA